MSSTYPAKNFVCSLAVCAIPMPLLQHKLVILLMLPSFTHWFCHRMWSMFISTAWEVGKCLPPLDHWVPDHGFQSRAPLLFCGKPLWDRCKQWFYIKWYHHAIVIDRNTVKFAEISFRRVDTRWQSMCEWFEKYQRPFERKVCLKTASLISTCRLESILEKKAKQN